MDKSINKLLWVSSITLAVVVLVGVMTVWPISNVKIGSVTQGNDYKYASSTTDTGMKRLVANKPATLGSVIVASTTNATFTIWNATSTTDTASNTVASFPALVGAGTYTFDITVPRGLIIKPGVGFLGQYIVTYR